MKLTLGQAAKEAGISKPSLSAAIKKGRLSASKNDSGVYEIDPAELFRVYPKKQEANPLDNSSSLTLTNGKKSVSSGVNKEVLDLLLAERDKLLEEKDKTIKRLEEEKSEIREDLQDQKDQSKRITLLLENQSSKGAGDWEKGLKALEERIANQEKSAKEIEDKALKLEEENRKLKKMVTTKEQALKEEKSKGFFKRLLG
tara:strand:- start:10975 stop:11574 length:600 start_codon:yes stop_codon:yes gene_type:complete